MRFLVALEGYRRSISQYHRMTHQFPFDIKAAESYIRKNHPELIFDVVTSTLQDGAGYLAKSGNFVVFRLPLVDFWSARSEQTSNRWAAFTDSELSCLYNALFASEEGGEDLDAIQIQMGNEMARRCEQEMKDESPAQIAEKVLGNRKAKVAGK